MGGCGCSTVSLGGGTSAGPLLLLITHKMLDFPGIREVGVQSGVKESGKHEAVGPLPFSTLQPKIGTGQGRK